MNHVEPLNEALNYTDSIDLSQSQECSTLKRYRSPMDKKCSNPITGEAQEEAKGKVEICKDDFPIAQNAYICQKGTISKKDTPLLILNLLNYNLSHFQ